MIRKESDDIFARACGLADRIPGGVVSSLADVESEAMYLRLDESGLSLVAGKMELRGDFGQMLRRVLGGNLQHEKLLRAARWKGMPDRPLAVDATAGLGEDSFILAAAGYHVILCEYNPIIAALLGDALMRAQGGDSGKAGSFIGMECGEELREIASRMELIEGDGAEILASLEERPDLVYLDPMFPAKRKSGISTKKLQIFQKLEAPCVDEEALMEAAWKAGPSRIIVKRPVKGLPLAGRRPGFSIGCKTVRYDCYLPSETV
ncbi:MAG: class I SAM-dependent methyltransferase [Lachnospiraceae bacterium]|nr:class I SAM-dependent methyltransferase [Lachnospiraceae bacterium]